MANEVLGKVTCPFCGNTEATVHQEARGLRALYYRCYHEGNHCGTVQIRYAGGQAWIKANMRPLTLPEQDTAKACAAHDAAEKQATAAKVTRKRSRLAAFLMEE